MIIYTFKLCKEDCSEAQGFAKEKKVSIFPQLVSIFSNIFPAFGTSVQFEVFPIQINLFLRLFFYSRNSGC